MVEDREDNRPGSDSSQVRVRPFPTEGAPERTRRLLDRLVSSSPDVILLLDRAATIQFASRDLPPFTSEELLGKGIFDVFEGTERERCRESVHEALSSEAPCDAEVSLRGHACWRLRFVSLSPDPGILTIATDIADERRVDSEVRHQQRLESLGALASGIAHDFNNLLTGILGSASLASMKLPPDSPAAGQIARVLAAAEKAAELTNKMLAFSGRGQIQPGRFDLNRVVEDVLPLVRSSLGTSVSLQLALAPNLPLIDADRLHLQHALVNLLTSAAESSASEIVVRTGAMAGSDSLSPPSVFLEVKDDGVGMDEEARARILDPVFDAEASGRWRALAAVTRIIRAHDGKVRVESAPDRGTCFTVLMPALRPTGAVLEDPL